MVPPPSLVTVAFVVRGSRRARIKLLLNHPVSNGVAQAVIASAAVLAVFAVAFASGLTPSMASNVLQVMSSMIAVAAGMAMLACWKVSGRSSEGLLGIGLVDFGLLSVSNYLTGLLRVHGTGAAEPFGRLVVCVVAASMTIAALRSPAVDAGLKPVRTLAATALVGLVCLVVLERLPGTWVQPDSATVQSETYAAFAVVWLAVAAYAANVVRQKDRPGRPWVAIFALLLAASGAAGVTFVHSGWGPAAVKLGFVLASSVALVVATLELRSIVNVSNRHAVRLRSLLDDLRGEMARQRSELDDRLHDLRNSVSALRSADAMLRRYDGRLDEATRNSLAEALSAELSRLQTLIEPGRRLQSVEFPLANVLAPVVFTEQSRGADIEFRVGDIIVLADPDAVAQVLQNLLVNACKYAPGPIEISAYRRSNRAEVQVTDHGPGVPESERLTIFGRGVRGSTSAGTGGTGVGLYVASRLTTEMGGSLRLADTAEGACFVVELPLGTAVVDEPVWRTAGDVAHII